MNDKITKHHLVTILSKINIIDLISSFINLERKGNNFLALCPFHDEKTPSFFVNANKKRYYCFGCHRSGDVIQFIINYKKIPFYEAVNFLSNCSPFEKKILNTNNKDFLQEATDLYIQARKDFYNLQTDVYNFFLKRNTPINIIEQFNLGFAENSWNFLLKKLGKTNDEKKKLLDMGLIIKKQNKIYDRFRNRIIFPIKNTNGKIIAFGARALDDNTKPKYINSPETLDFSKKQTLYGLYEALCTGKNKTIIIVEGYFDVITLHKYGITNVAAVLGSFFSKEHFKMLSFLYEEITFCYDNDKAGNLAAIRTAYSCLSYLDVNVSINFVFLPKNCDPDNFLNSGNKKVFIKLLNTPIYLLDYIFDNLSFNLKFNTLKDKILLFNRLNKLLKHISNITLKKIILKHFLNLLKINDYKKNIVSTKKHALTSLGMKACFFLLKKKTWVLQIDLHKLISNKKISFHSDIYIFFELILLLQNNINLGIKDLNNMLRRKINPNEFFKLLDSFPESILKDEFFTLIEKISNIDIIEN